jgi:hypothetical protein
MMRHGAQQPVPADASPVGESPLNRSVGQRHVAGLLERFRRFRARLKPGPLAEWFHVRFDDESIYLDVSPPGRDPWKDQFRWSSIERARLRLDHGGVPLVDHAV